MQTGTLAMNFKNAGDHCKLYVFKNTCPNRFDKIQELNWYYMVDFTNNQIIINYKSELQYESSGYIETLPIETGTYFVFNSFDNFNKPDEVLVVDGLVTQYNPESYEDKSNPNAYYDALMDLIY